LLIEVHVAPVRLVTAELVEMSVCVLSYQLTDREKFAHVVGV
jgi:hypothetical protein